MEPVQVTFIGDEIAAKVQKTYNPSIKLLKWEVDKESTAAKHHILSETYRLLLTCQSNTGVFVKSFFVKSPSKLDNYKRNLVGPVIEKELNMYKNILPAFCEVSTLKLPCIKSYYLHTDGSIIMEDLAQEQYQWYNCASPLNIEHCIYALRALAKFHAHSVRINETCPTVLDQVRNYELLETLLQDRENKKVWFGNRFLKLLALVDPIFVEQNKARLMRAKEKFFETAIEEAAGQSARFGVLNHGDFWITNMMFKYDKAGAIEDIKFFDFQFSHWASPANDLIRFFMMSTDFEIFEQHYQQFLDEYLIAIQECLKYLGCKKWYTMDELQLDIEKKTTYWILLLIWLAPLFFSTGDEFHGDIFAENLIEDKNFQPVLKKWMPFLIERIMRNLECKLFTY